MPEQSFFTRYRFLLPLTLAVIFLLGLGIRLYDLTDPPLDFHSTRQLRSALMARGLYALWEPDFPEPYRQTAINQWRSHQIIEPPLVEGWAALTYKLAGGEHVWLARIWSSLFWLIGGAALFALARDMTGVDGGVIALAFYTFLPFAVVASRSFQPDPLMTAAIVVAWWAFYRWHQAPSLKRAVGAGLAAGFALLVKNVAVFFLLLPMAGVLVFGPGLKKALRDRQVWLIAGLAALPVVIYTLFGIFALKLAGQFEGRFFPELLKDPSHYVKWLYAMIDITGFPAILLGLLGMFIFGKPAQRAFGIGLWAGYGIYGLLFPYHFLTHNYYHLPWVPVVGLSLAPVADPVFRWIAGLKPGVLLRTGIIAVLLFGMGYQLWEIRITLFEDFRHEPAYWEMIGEVVGHDTQVVALSQDYGNRIGYYGWVDTLNWPGVGHFNYRELRGGKPVEFPEWFAEYTEGKDFFLVTRLRELDRQPELKDALYNGYVIYAEGEGYVVFDLKHPLTP
jgi:4-amino-4-deoxy-L-arabinose transferase-like glycosyltransferase